ncbi:Trypsin 3A1 [Frankliniella fusca]|uniref:Trypsin 3A1 n=1 Tax=Frankliniella fusca TaxID=407009 RepID=A0AAE1HAD2_9NEOP|nr:Trypsin 3A1 [Frankliniella fusca]
MLRAGLLIIGAVCVLGASAGPRLPRTHLQIVGGHPVKIEEVPFQISLEKYSAHSCGGSILSQQWVLTAAHCLLYDSDVASYAVRYATDVKEQGGTLLPIKMMAYHDQYDDDRHSHDVAVLQVAKDIVYSAKAQPIKLPTVGVLPLSTDTLSVSGWGLEHMDSGGPLVNGLGVQVGLVSWGIGCGAPGYAGVYANLACPNNRAWIRSKTSIG